MSEELKFFFYYLPAGIMASAIVSAIIFNWLVPPAKKKKPH